MNFSWQSLLSGSNWHALAQLSPRLVLMLLAEGSKQPASYTIRVQFDTGNAGDMQTGRMEEKMFQDAWVKDLVYTIRRPSANLGSLWRAQNDEYTKRNPYIDVRFRTQGSERWELTANATPLENIGATVHDRLFADGPWILPRNMNLLVDMTLMRTLGDGELPYIVDITLNVIEVSGCACDLRQIEWSRAYDMATDMVQKKFPQFMPADTPHIGPLTEYLSRLMAAQPQGPFGPGLTPSMQQGAQPGAPQVMGLVPGAPQVMGLVPGAPQGMGLVPGAPQGMGLVPGAPQGMGLTPDAQSGVASTQYVPGMQQQQQQWLQQQQQLQQQQSQSGPNYLTSKRKT